MRLLLLLKKFKARRRFWLGIVVGVASTVTIGVVLYNIINWRDRVPERADIAGVVLTYQLQTAAQKLQKSLDTPLDANTGQTTKSYIGYMQDIEKACQGLQDSLAKSKKESASSDTTVYLTKSGKLCDELSPIAANSRKLYQASLPVLSIDAHLKRYQTLPLVWESIRGGHLKTVESAITPTREAAGAMEFPTQAASQLAQLQNDIKTSQQLGYYPALAQYQRSLLAERQRYWASDGELQNLIDALKVQVGHYCSNLPSKDSHSLFECR